MADRPDPGIEPAGPRLLVLASGSPRRAELLGRIVEAFEVDPANTDESPLHDEEPTAYVARIAREKAVAVASRRPGVFVIGADTTIALGGEVIGKPVDDDDAREMLARLSGGTHEVLTGVALVTPRERNGAPVEPLVHVEHAEVTFGRLTAGEIDSYVASSEPRGKAGAYAIQGLGAVLVERMQGDPTTVVGLPLRPTRRMLAQAGFPQP